VSEAFGKTRLYIHSKEEALFVCLKGDATANPAAAANSIISFSLISVISKKVRSGVNAN
jgi:hypothetical protein